MDWKAGYFIPYIGGEYLDGHEPIQSSPVSLYSSRLGFRRQECVLFVPWRGAITHNGGTDDQSRNV